MTTQTKQEDLSDTIAYLHSRGQQEMAVKLIWLEEKYNQLIKKELLESEQRMKEFEKCCCYQCEKLMRGYMGDDCACDMIPTYKQEKCAECPKSLYCDVPSSPELYPMEESEKKMNLRINEIKNNLLRRICLMLTLSVLPILVCVFALSEMWQGRKYLKDDIKNIWRLK